MAVSLLQLLFSGLVVGTAVALAWRLTPARDRREDGRRLLEWSVKGLLVPFLLWAVMNLGVSWDLQPFMPAIQAAQRKGAGWFPVYCQYVGNGLAVICSDWAAITTAWVIWRSRLGLDPEKLRQLKALAWVCAAGLSLPAAIIVLVGGWAGLGLAAMAILAPLAAFSRQIITAPKRLPLYSRAVAKLNFGRYAEAEAEIIKELENCEDDFEGWLMMAGLYANHFHDLAEAEKTVLELCDQPNLTHSQISIALQRLADWQLKVGGDPAAARRALQILCDRCRGTHLGHMARLRLEQLPATRDEWRQQEQGIPMPALGDQLDESPSADSGAARREAGALANQYVETLTRNPNDAPTRERLARLFAERLDRADLGLDQLQLLLDIPGQPESLRVEWLSLMAAWQLKYRQNEAAARVALERLLREFPHTPQALAARRRLQLLDARRQEAGAAASRKPIRLSPE